jgi:hypothetical protein
VLADPEVPFVPDHPVPPAVQEVALVEVQERVEEPPLEIEVGEALKLTTGSIATITVTLSEALPPVPVQVIV